MFKENDKVIVTKLMHLDWIGKEDRKILQTYEGHSAKILSLSDLSIYCVVTENYWDIEFEDGYKINAIPQFCLKNIKEE